MNKRSTIKQQLLAGCLLMVFLFITFAKLMHSHENSDGIGFTSNTEQVAKSSDCSICDFHFTKDTDFQSTSFVFQKVEATCISPVFYQSRTTTSIGLSYSDRGPPVRS